MKNLKSVYAYRYDAKEGKWTQREIENVLISGTLDSFSLSHTQNRNAKVILRVMSDKKIDIYPEDIISFDKSTDNKPDMQKCAVVVSVTDNRRGTKRLKHTKILCR